MADLLDPCYLRSFQNHRLSVNWIAFSPNSKYLASASADKSVILWTLDDKSNVCYKYTGHSDAVTSVSMTNSFIITSSKDCTARLWRLDQMDGLSHSSNSSIYRCHQSPVRSLDINADESQFCTSSDDKTVKLWSVSSTNKLIATMSGVHQNWVRNVRFSKLNPFLVSSCGDDGIICVWDIRTKEAAIKLTSKRRTTHFLSVQWHPNWEYILSSSSSDFSVRIWDLRFEKTVQCYQVHDGFVSSADFHSSGAYLISSSFDSTCKILDLYEGRTLFTLKAHTGPVNCAQFSPSGEHFATAGQDHTILYWKSNLTSNENAIYDDDTNSILSFDPVSTPVNSFESDQIKSIGSKITTVKLESNSDDSQEPQSVNLSSKLAADSVSIAASEHSEHQDETPNDSLNLNANSVSILKCIITQMETFTESILHIERRLTNLERKFTELSL